MKQFFIIVVLLHVLCSAVAQKALQTDVLVIGGGTGGTAAGIQSARLGAKTIIVESTPWLGGMITAAGVSATDGNHRLPSGIWNEFRTALYKVYGGPKAVETGWVSNTQFEPHVGDSIFKSMAAAEKNLQVLYGCVFVSLKKENQKISSALFKNKKTGELLTVVPKIVIDATELGDVLAAAKLPYDVGMEDETLTGENVGIKHTNNIIQDLTYVAILKDYGAGKDCTITKPANFNPAEFDGSNTDYYFDTTRKAPSVNAKKMLDYGRLPNGKYMLNWPVYGNDIYLNIIALTEAEREQELVKAKEQTLRFIYFIQHTLGFKHLGLADDEFPTADRLALMPYHREGRRVKGLVRFTMRHIAEPFTYGDPLYRTGISVGDYPIDHHHKKNAAAPQHLEFYPVPSFNVPLGALLSNEADNLIIAEKGISVSNVANGTTRLQPCVLLTGQSAGVLAALSTSLKKAPQAIPVRFVQTQLLKAKAYIMPYIDVPAAHPHFEAAQKIGATGILKGTGVPYKWANQTWFYPDSLVNAKAFVKDLNEFKKGLYRFANTEVTIAEALKVLTQLKPGWQKKGQNSTAHIKTNWATWGLKNFNLQRNITRLELAVLFNKTIDPFLMKAVNHKGVFLNESPF